LCGRRRLTAGGGGGVADLTDQPLIPRGSSGPDRPCTKPPDVDYAAAAAAMRFASLQTVYT